MTNVDLVAVETDDGVHLDGVLRTPESGTTQPPAVDVVICHHGHGGNFYNPSFFDAAAESFLSKDCAVLRVNSRGHDDAYSRAGQRLGAAYEIVDDCRHDWKAWIDFAQGRGYRRVALWGHSLGALKTIHYLAHIDDARVMCAIASSPPRFSYATFLASDVGARFDYDLDRASQLLQVGQPEALVEAAVPLETFFAARTYVDKYGPADRYDFFQHMPNVRVPLLLTLGSLEDALAFEALARRGPTLRDELPLVRYVCIDGADHSYTAKAAELTHAVRVWLDSVAAPVVPTGS
jgi:dipeptidyl aminopeptidase/acylaminoacyl peptidase